MIIAKAKHSSSSWHLYLSHDNNQLSLGEKLIKLHACINVNAVEKASKSAQSSPVCVSNVCTSFVRSVLLYVHGDSTDYHLGRGAQGTHLVFHTVQCCFTSTELMRTIRDGGAQDVHLDFHATQD